MNALNQLKYIASEYSKSLAAAKALTTAASAMGSITHRYPKRPYQMTSSLVQRQLTARYHDYLDDWIRQHPTESAREPDTNRPPYAWMCWLQGPRDLPEFLRTITDTQRRFLEQYRYTIISLDNVDDFIDLPGYIYDKFKAGTITPVHLTDLIRVSLLEQYGGIWIDATVLLTSSVPLTVVQRPFYTIKGIDMDFPASQKYPEIQKWEGYYIAGQPHALLYAWMKDFLFEYWKHESRLIHYLMINQAAMIAIDAIPLIRDEYRELPATNQSCELLSPALEHGTFQTLVPFTKNGTYAFKLSRHVHYNGNILQKVLQQLG